MSRLIASDAALAAVVQLVAVYGLRRPVLCVMRNAAAVDLARGVDGEVVRSESVAGYSAMVIEADSIIGSPIPLVPWKGIELLCDLANSLGTQLSLEVVDGELQVFEREF